MADHILTEDLRRLQAENGDFLVLALDLLGTPLFRFFAPPRRRGFAAPVRTRGFASPKPRRSFKAPGSL